MNQEMEQGIQKKSIFEVGIASDSGGGNYRDLGWVIEWAFPVIDAALLRRPGLDSHSPGGWGFEVE